MTNEELEKASTAFFALSAFLEQVTPSPSLKRELEGELSKLIRSAVSQAYEEGIKKAQEIRDTLHLRPLFDDHHCSGADMAAEEMQEYLRRLKDSLVKDGAPARVREFAERRQSQPAYLAGRNSPCDVLGLQPNMVDAAHDDT